MDTDKIQQINELANELKKHHFANSSEDAFKRAEETMSIHVAEPAKEEPALDEKPADKLLERRFELLLEMNNKKYEQELDAMREALNAVIAELNSLKAEVAKKAEVPKEAPKEVPAEPSKEEKNEESHPRQGDFTSDDVNIQEMFYFGNK